MRHRKAQETQLEHGSFLQLLLRRLRLSYLLITHLLLLRRLRLSYLLITLLSVSGVTLLTSLKCEREKDGGGAPSVRLHLHLQLRVARLFECVLSGGGEAAPGPCVSLSRPPAERSSKHNNLELSNLPRF